eukprot:4601753-Prymnesium_polylepis.1
MLRPRPTHAVALAAVPARSAARPLSPLQSCAQHADQSQRLLRLPPRLARPRARVLVDERAEVGAHLVEPRSRRQPRLSIVSEAQWRVVQPRIALQEDC